MKPQSPVLLRRIKIKIIRMVESAMAVLKVNTCWSSPFKIPSDILSRYIKGTIGESALSKNPMPLLHSLSPPT